MFHFFILRVVTEFLKTCQINTNCLTAPSIKIKLFCKHPFTIQLYNSMFVCECLSIRYIWFAFDFHADIPNLFTQTAFSRYPCEKSIIKLSLCMWNMQSNSIHLLYFMHKVHCFAFDDHQICSNELLTNFLTPEEKSSRR